MKEMDRATRLAIIKKEKDELGELVSRGDFSVPECPKCNTTMDAKRPNNIQGILPKFDYKCPKCGACLSSSGIVS